MAEETIWR